MRLLAAIGLLLLALPAAALEKVTLQLNWKHQFQFAGYYAAIEKGYYREAGFEVRLVEAGEVHDPIEAVLKGQAEFGVGASELALRRGRGEPVVALATILQHSPLVLLAGTNKRIESIHDLAGKRIMLMPHETELYAYLKREGIASYQPLRHTFDTRDLVDGKTDALSGYVTDEPFVLQQDKFSYAVFSPRSSGIDFYGDTLFTTEKQVRAHPERVAAFREASLRGWRFAMQNPGEIADLILTRYGNRHSRAHLLFEAAEMGRLMQVDLVEIGHMLPGRWQHIAETYAELGMLPGDFSIEGLIWNPKPRVLPAWVVPGYLAGALFLLVAGVTAWRFMRLNRRLADEIAAHKQAEESLRTANEQLQTRLDEIHHLQAALDEQATRDGLTGLYNRRHLDEILEREIVRAKREGHFLALVMIDVDHFKRFNDTYGHQAGDQVLVALADLLRTDARTEDVVCRYGGEEFLVLLPHMSPESARARAELWRSSFAATEVRHGELALRTTISLGIAAYPEHGHTVEELTQCADLALYLAKHDGRDRAVVFEVTPLALDV